MSPFLKCDSLLLWWHLTYGGITRTRDAILRTINFIVAAARVRAIIAIAKASRRNAACYAFVPAAYNDRQNCVTSSRRIF